MGTHLSAFSFPEPYTYVALGAPGHGLCFSDLRRARHGQPVSRARSCPHTSSELSDELERMRGQVVSYGFLGITVLGIVLLCLGLLAAAFA